MKEIATTILRNLGRVFGLLALCSFATAGTAFADTITKSFEFGPGTPYTRSNVRTFPVPCRKAVAVTVKFQTLGAAGASNLVPITIELREPDTAQGQEGPLVEAKNITARTTEQTVTLSGPILPLKNRGCSLPWRVRVKHANDGPAPFLTTGTIKLDFDSAVRNIKVDPNLYVRSRWDGRNRITINLGSTGGREEGTIELKGDWRHYILGGGTGPNTIYMEFNLIDPNGTVVKTAGGYADRQRERDLGLPILKLIYKVPNCTPGQWKLEIRNTQAVDEAIVDEISEKFTPDCP